MTNNFHDMTSDERDRWLDGYAAATADALRDHSATAQEFAAALLRMTPDVDDDLAYDAGFRARLRTVVGDDKIIESAHFAAVPSVLAGIPLEYDFDFDGTVGSRGYAVYVGHRVSADVTEYVDGRRSVGSVHIGETDLGPMQSREIAAEITTACDAVDAALRALRAAE